RGWHGSRRRGDIPRLRKRCRYHIDVLIRDYRKRLIEASGGNVEMENVTKTLDAKGLGCPMPVVRTKKAIEELSAGEILEVVVTDRGSIADIPMWAKNTGHEYLELVEEGDVLKHYVRKGGKTGSKKEEPSVVKTITNEEYLEIA